MCKETKYEMWKETVNEHHKPPPPPQARMLLGVWWLGSLLLSAHKSVYMESKVSSRKLSIKVSVCDRSKIKFSTVMLLW